MHWDRCTLGQGEHYFDGMRQSSKERSRRIRRKQNRIQKHENITNYGDRATEKRALKEIIRRSGNGLIGCEIQNGL